MALCGAYMEKIIQYFGVVNYRAKYLGVPRSFFEVFTTPRRIQVARVGLFCVRWMQTLCKIVVAYKNLR